MKLWRTVHAHIGGVEDLQANGRGFESIWRGPDPYYSVKSDSDSQSESI
jgi:hypothetical protein